MTRAERGWFFAVQFAGMAMVSALANLIDPRPEKVRAMSEAILMLVPALWGVITLQACLARRGRG